MHDGPAGPPDNPVRYRHLPLLSLLLVIFVAIWLARHYWPTEHKRRIAAYDTALQFIGEHYVGEASEEGLHRAAMHGMLDALPDPYSNYMDPEEAKETMEKTEGEFGGIGVMLRTHDGGAIVIEVFDGPAGEAGIKPQDVIVGVDGKSTEGEDLQHLVRRIKGEIGENVTLDVRRADTGEVEQFELTRALVRIPNIDWEVAAPGIGFIRIRQFDKHTTAEMRDALNGLREQDALRGLVLDVRDNPGGLLDQAVSVVDMFVDRGTIVKLSSRLAQERLQVHATPKLEAPLDVPMVVLVDSHSASASEVMAGALQALGRATLIGVKTFGKGSVNKVHPLPDDAMIMLTVSHYMVASGKVIEGNGVEPDITVGDVAMPESVDRAAVAEWMEKLNQARAQQRARAIEVLTEKLAAPQQVPEPASVAGD